MTFSRILLVWAINAIVLLLEQAVESSFLGNGRYTDNFHSFGHEQLYQILLKSVVISGIASVPSSLINSIGKSSEPGLFPVAIALIADLISLSRIAGSSL